MQEQKYLTLVKQYINDQIGKLSSELRRMIAERKENVTYIWNNLQNIDVNKNEKAYWAQKTELDDFFGNTTAKEIKQLNRALLSPFFGEMTLIFKHEGSPETYYIGLRELYDEKNGLSLVLDWRSPVAGLFYEGDIGMCVYQSPSGPIEAEMTDKTQILVQNGEIKAVTEIDSPVYDTLLFYYLKQNATHEMKNIAASLQKEQNRVIRLGLNVSAFIIGPAGSGKTSIALHRAAFLLYKNASLKSEQMAFISPKKYLHQYISGVLPSLNEDNIPLCSYDDLRNDISFFTKMDYGFLPANLTVHEQYTLLMSLNEYVEFLKAKCFQLENITFITLMITKEELSRLFWYTYSELPLFARMQQVRMELRESYGPLFYEEEKKEFFKHLFTQLNRMYKELTLQSAYDDFVQWLGCEKGIRLNDSCQGIDMDIALLLQHILFRSNTNQSIKYLIVDELQDLTLLQHAVLRARYRCPFLAVGDFNQSLLFTQNDLELIRQVFNEKAEVIQLFNCYRSTYEIVEFSKRVIKHPEILSVQRHGDPVQWYLCSNIIEKYSDFEKLLHAETDNHRWNTMAVIVPDAESCISLSSALQKSGFSIAVNCLKPDCALSVFEIDQVKGLEFDCVFIYDADKLIDQKSGGTNRLYIGSTRALHKLILISERLDAGIDLKAWLPEKDIVVQ
ncbi:MAG TPA: AAA family ATPase [Oscillospiraceae bacterium]|nr:AAA family ATPase [Oscillospiraceae bacterium]HPS35465.1 AAA family ATPase [Oscillospiraceae bacterium]